MTRNPGPLDAAERRDGLDALAAVEAMTRFDVAAYELCEPRTAEACRTQRDMLVCVVADMIAASQGGAQVVIDAVRRNLLAPDTGDTAGAGGTGDAGDAGDALSPQQRAAIADLDPATRDAIEGVWQHEKRMMRGEDDDQ